MEYRAMLKLLTRSSTFLDATHTTPILKGLSRTSCQAFNVPIAFKNPKLKSYTQVKIPTGQCHKIGHSSAFVCSARWCSTQIPHQAPSSNESETNINYQAELTLNIVGGLPHLIVPLPSRRESCRFSLRPITHTVRDLIDHLQKEDRGIDRVVVSTIDNIRIASSSTIESLLNEDFYLVINDNTYKVIVPPSHKHSLEELKDLGDVRQLVNKLYSALNIDQHQVEKERDILEQIEEIKTQLTPLEKTRDVLVSQSERRTNILAWAGLGYMALQFGFLARLTWWEYSWDIMEPVTYFVTYGTAIAAYAYYVLTKQDFILADVRDREFLIAFHKKGRKAGLDVNRYNFLKERLYELELDLTKLRDPLALNLPPTHVKQRPEIPPAKENPLK